MKLEKSSKICGAFPFTKMLLRNVLMKIINFIYLDTQVNFFLYFTQDMI